MKQVVTQPLTETVSLSKVVFSTNKPIALKDTQGNKFLLIRIYGKQDNDPTIWHYSLLGLTNYAVFLKKEEDFFMTDLLETKINQGYQVFLFESQEEFYNWCAE